MEYVCGYIINFADGGKPEGQILHTGTLKECQTIFDRTPAVSYSGGRQIKDCRMIIKAREEEGRR